MKRRVSLFAASLVVGGCTLGPAYERPAPAVPMSWPVGDAYLKRSEADLPNVGYRDLFHDPKLQAVIAQSVTNNQDVRFALANVETARGQLQAQRAALLPNVAGTTGATRSRGGIVEASNGVVSSSAQRTAYNVNVGLSAFEIDLFGRVRSLSDAALQQYLSTEAAVRAARLTLVGQVATTYLTLATDRSLLVIARDTVTTASRSVELTRARLAGGVAPRSDVRQAETVLAQARADLAQQTTLVAQDRNALELLVGAPVSDADLPDTIEAVDGMLDELPVGLDSQVLLRRPDVVQAEYQLRSANARIGAARAAFFPTISLTAVAGLASNALSTLATGNAFAWSVGPTISLPIFDAGLREGNLVVAESQRDAAVATYQRTIQSAFRDVADALARRGTIGDQFRAQADLEAAARDSYALADARYREGIDPFLTSLDAQRTLYNARRSLATVRLTRATNLVTLLRVLGGSTD